MCVLMYKCLNGTPQHFYKIGLVLLTMVYISVQRVCVNYSQGHVEAKRQYLTYQGPGRE